jgi:myosin heavy subunit
VKFNDSDSCEEVEDSEPEERPSGSCSIAIARRDAAVLSLQQVLNRQGGIDFGSSSSFVKKVEVGTKKSQVICRRFVVENVTEKEHLQQQEDKSIDNDEDSIPSKFENVKNIDLVSKSDSEKSTPRSSRDSRSSFIDELRRNKEMMLENMRKAESRVMKNEDGENKITTIQSVWSSKMLRSLELSKEGSKSPSLDSPRSSLEIVKNTMMKEHEQEIQVLKQDLDSKLEKIKQHIEEDFNAQKLSLQSSIQERLDELRKKMAEEEKQDVDKLVAEMNEARAENLKKVKNELEVCYEKERQDILVNIKSELDQRKRELLEIREQQISILENEYEKGLKDEKQAKAQELQITKQYSEKAETLKKELEKQFDILSMELRIQQRDKIAKITEDHEKCLADILRDFRKDVSIIMNFRIIQVFIITCVFFFLM